MANGNQKQTEIASLADALRQRIAWEVENGCAGYQPVPPEQIEAAAVVEDPRQALERLRREIGDCTRCELSARRQKLVFGEGSPSARLVFVGEGPGRDEDLSGRPFVGKAGQLLDRIIAAIQLKREQVYICNVVKCRPPGNRTPDEEECAICGAFLRSQLAILKPEIVVSLGATATRFLLDRNEALGRQRGRFHQVGELHVMPTYHPAYLLRNPQQKRAVWEDMQKVASALGLDISTGKG